MGKRPSMASASTVPGAPGALVDAGQPVAPARVVRCRAPLETAMFRTRPARKPRDPARTTLPRRGFRLDFLGATGTVTGSRYLLTASGHRVLVDCGLFQGYKPLRLRNWERFPVDPARIEAVVLTHAHLDHSGYLPLLVRQGFRGPVFCTAPTAALCRLLLLDSAHLLEEEAKYANRKGTSKHHPALPLYTQADAEAALRQLRVVRMGEAFVPVPGMTATCRGAGHILGAASVTLEHDGTRIGFSGDLGRSDDLVMPAPEPPGPADLLVVESTYGDRRHATADAEAELGAVVARVAARGGVVVIPAFAVGRAQVLLHLLGRLKARGAIPRALPVYLNSPMADEATLLYARFPAAHLLSPADTHALRDSATVITTAEQSKALNRRHGPMVIISASGMATGGRVIHHLRAFAPDPRNAIVLAGFQAGGTRGAKLAAGDATLRIFGEDVPVRAEVVQLGASSAHADADGLIAWLRSAPEAPRRVFVTHGEPAAADALRLRIDRELGWRADVPDWLQAVDLHALAGRAATPVAVVPVRVPDADPAPV
jgi:metallo-beta-lactamase family protein